MPGSNIPEAESTVRDDSEGVHTEFQLGQSNLTPEKKNGTDGKIRTEEERQG